MKMVLRWLSYLVGIYGVYKSMLFVSDLCNHINLESKKNLFLTWAFMGLAVLMWIIAAYLLAKHKRVIFQWQLAVIALIGIGILIYTDVAPPSNITQPLDYISEGLACITYLNISVYLNLFNRSV